MKRPLTLKEKEELIAKLHELNIEVTRAMSLVSVGWMVPNEEPDPRMERITILGRFVIIDTKPNEGPMLSP